MTMYYNIIYFYLFIFFLLLSVYQTCITWNFEKLDITFYLKVSKVYTYNNNENYKFVDFDMQAVNLK